VNIVRGFGILFFRELSLAFDGLPFGNICSVLGTNLILVPSKVKSLFKRVLLVMHKYA
jgi:hypothetical protein